MYSLEIRKRIFELIQSGKSQREIARDFQIPFRTIQRWVRAVREGKGLEPKSPNKKCYKINKEELRIFIDNNKTMALKEIAKVFGVHLSSIWRHLRILNVPLRKKPLRKKKKYTFSYIPQKKIY